MSNAERIVDLYERSSSVWDTATIAWWVKEAWDPEIDWRALPGAPDDVGPMHGADRLARYYGEWIELFKDIHNELRGARDVAGKVVAEVHVSALARSTDMPLELSYAIVYEFGDDGRIVRGREYAT